MSAEQEFDAIFDGIMKFSKAVHAADERRKEIARLIEQSSKLCGNCRHWMKSRDCPIDDQRKGYPSCQHYGCSKFTPTNNAVFAAERLKAMLSSKTITKDGAP